MTPPESEPSLVDLLADLVAIDSINPPGRETAVCEFLVRHLEARGIVPRVLSFEPGRPSLAAEIPGERPGAFVLSGHLDTVAPAEGWHTPPLSLVERDGRLYGLGACDMKGGVAVLVHAFLEMAGRGRPRHTLRLLLSADEEERYLGAAHFHQQGLLDDALFAIVAEPSGGKVQVAEMGPYWVRVRFTGKEAHGSTPHEGVNAALAGARFLAALEGRMKQAPPRGPLGPTIWSPGKITGGRQINIVPDACTLEIDFRVGSDPERDAVATLLNEEGARATPPGGGFSWEIVNSVPAKSADRDDPLVMSFRRAYAVALGREPEVTIAPYCTDLPNLFPGPNPPFVIFGPGDIAQAHQPDEFTTRESLRDALAVVTGFLGGELGLG